ncbi:DUF4829 domain-containing protein [Clostridium tetani]|uniref:DUF4829 domain-containing protein n=1 Tax=Clostridium tetani (strain Massachusetts / E88) TaxID=212717 RepID=Q894R2_CLOTE|nr:DUF4829 domain-containing protein [Clostridium tetani]AAO36030.1 hypothetical protein CTC_01473 [Clostridium tetani E88]KGI38018.1 hypothetical protein KY52_10910 [Clostridium tetani]KGI43109.1 hypothetical protein KY54_10765 [Clostridium tetani]KHO32036.1 hypothetical protein OR63_07530 [Clostridium tetani]KIG22156.1 hypothetical protein RS78_00105 [Clostridium tetani]
MKKSYMMIIMISILFGVKLIYSNSAESIIKEYYKVIDSQQDVGKYNKLVIEDERLKNLEGIPDIVEKRDILELKKLNVNEHPLLEKELNYKYADEKDNVRYYMIKYDIKFKENVATPVDSGIYYEVITVVKRKNKWLVTTDIRKASFHNDKLTIDS